MSDAIKQLLRVRDWINAQTEDFPEEHDAMQAFEVLPLIAQAIRDLAPRSTPQCPTRLPIPKDDGITHEPLYMVQERVEIFGVSESYHEDAHWYSVSNDDPTDIRPIGKEEGRWSDDAERYHVAAIYRWEDIQPFFTREAADRYIRVNRHNLTEPRIYAISLHRNPEMIAVRNHLKSLCPELEPQQEGGGSCP